jgi:hypothetical protein
MYRLGKINWCKIDNGHATDKARLKSLNWKRRLPESRPHVPFSSKYIFIFKEDKDK